jgi:hypothetical protein
MKTEEANKLAALMTSSTNNAERCKLFCELSDMTVDYWSGKNCSEYSGTPWGRAFIFELGFGEDGISLPWDYRNSDGYGLLPKIFEHIRLRDTGKRHTDGTRVVAMALEIPFASYMVEEICKEEGISPC